MDMVEAKRCLLLADRLDVVPDQQFDIGDYYRDDKRCGTVAYAIGWACLLPEFQALGLSIGYIDRPLYNGVLALGSQLGTEFFGMTEEETDVFFPDGYGSGDPSPRDVATRLRRIVAAHPEAGLVRPGRAGRRTGMKLCTEKAGEQG